MFNEYQSGRNHWCLALFFLGLMIGACLSGNAQSEKDTARFSIGVRADLVELFLNVRDQHGSFVAGLGKESFRVFDDGEFRELAFFESETQPVTVVMLLDTSGSMQGSMFYLQLAACSFLANLRDQDQVALYSFGGLLKEIAPLTKNKSELMDEVSQLYADGGTPLYDAVVRVLRMMRNIHGRKALLLFTDGVDSNSRLSFEIAVRHCGRSSVPVFTVGCGGAIEDHALRKRLDALTNNSGGQSIYVKDTGDLHRSFTRLSQLLLTTYYAGYYSGRPPDGQWHSVLVEAKSEKHSVSARNGYYLFE